MQRFCDLRGVNLTDLENFPRTRILLGLGA